MTPRVITITVAALWTLPALAQVAPMQMAPAALDRCLVRRLDAVAGVG